MHNWKSRLKNPTDVDTSKFAKRVDLVNFKSDVDKWDIDKLKNIPINLINLKNKVDKIHVDRLVPVPFDLSKLNDLVKDDVDLSKLTDVVKNENDVGKNDAYNTKIKNG